MRSDYQPRSEFAVLAFIGLVILAIVVICRFELRCLRDLARRSDQELRYLNRAGWLAVILFAVPLGGLCYLRYGRRS